MRKNVLILAILLSACATRPAPVWETNVLPRPYQPLGPVEVTEEVSENTEDTVSGLAGFFGKNRNVSGQIPGEVATALEAKRSKHKDMIFEKLGKKARQYGADAVVGVEYSYVPAFASLSSKGVVSAKGTMVKYQ